MTMKQTVYMSYVADELKLEYSQVRRAVRSLAKKGLTEYLRGLMTEDGLVAGSGYCCTKEGHNFINSKYEI